MKGVNLHATARQAVSILHPERMANLFRCTGQVNVKGSLTPTYAESVTVSIQMQSVSDDALYHSNRTGQNATTRKVWVTVPQEGIDGLNRGLGLGGDMLQLQDGSWWLVDAVLEDFSASGWKSLRIVRQTREPVIQEAP